MHCGDIMVLAVDQKRLITIIIIMGGDTLATLICIMATPMHPSWERHIHSKSLQTYPIFSAENEINERKGRSKNYGNYLEKGRFARLVTFRNCLQGAERRKFLRRLFLLVVRQLVAVIGDWGGEAD